MPTISDIFNVDNLEIGNSIEVHLKKTYYYESKTISREVMLGTKSWYERAFFLSGLSDYYINKRLKEKGVAPIRTIKGKYVGDRPRNEYADGIIKIQPNTRLENIEAYFIVAFNQIKNLKKV